jgi:hypothetical protein
MGRDYGRILRDRGQIVLIDAASKGNQAWHLWLEMDLGQRTRFCKKQGLSAPKPPEYGVLGGVGQSCAMKFGWIWRSLTGKQRRAFCARAGLQPVPPAELARDQGDEAQHEP